MYVDGLYSAKGEGWKGSRENPVTEDIDNPGWYPMTIGRDLWQGEGSFFRGELDELRISNVVRDFSTKWPTASSGTVISPTVNFEGETVTGVIIEPNSHTFFGNRACASESSEAADAVSQKPNLF